MMINLHETAGFPFHVSQRETSEFAPRLVGMQHSANIIGEHQGIEAADHQAQEIRQSKLLAVLVEVLRVSMRQKLLRR